MRGMTNDDEVVSPTVDDPTPLPGSVGGLPSEPPTPLSVLALVAAARGEPWFPSRYAADLHADRDALDDPLNQLRLAGLIRVAAWERGAGQGYVLTPEGETALARGAEVPGTPSQPPLDETSEIGIDSSALNDQPAESLAVDAHPTIVVPILLASNLLWFFVGLVMVLRAGQPAWQYISEGNKEILHRIGAVYGLDLLHGQWWRLASSCFVHIGGPHLLFNLFALIMVGPLAELLWGRKRLIVIYVFSGLAGSCLAMALTPESLLAGASGAIWGLLMSLVAWFILFRPYLPAEVVSDSIRRLTVVIVLNAMFSFMPGISWQAHLGGAVVGFATAWLLNAMRFGDRRRRSLALALLVTMAFACVTGLLVAMRWSEAWAGYRQRIADEQAWLAADQKRIADEQAWLAADQKRRAAETATSAFNRDVVPLLEKLYRKQPVNLRADVHVATVPLVWFEVEVALYGTDLGWVEVDPDELHAFYQLIRPGTRRNAARVADLHRS